MFIKKFTYFSAKKGILYVHGIVRIQDSEFIFPAGQLQLGIQDSEFIFPAGQV